MRLYGRQSTALFQHKYTQFPRDGSNKFGSVFHDGIIGTRIVHHSSAFVAAEVASLVVVHDGHARVDVINSVVDLVNLSPAIVMVHADARSRIDNRLYRVTARTQRRLQPA